MTQNSLVKTFKRISYIEGLSLLLLLFIAMPLKYKFDSPSPVKVLGWIHGILFIVYLVNLAVVVYKLKWSFLKTTCALGASVLPFGPFIFESQQHRIK